MHLYYIRHWHLRRLMAVHHGACVCVVYAIHRVPNHPHHEPEGAVNDDVLDLGHGDHLQHGVAEAVQERRAQPPVHIHR